MTATARALVDRAEVLIGGARVFAMVPEDGRERLNWPNSLSAMIGEIAARRGQRVCVLATGDPCTTASAWRSPKTFPSRR